MTKTYSILGQFYELPDVAYFYDSLSLLDLSKEISDEVLHLDEDLLQVSFSDADETTIDVGWYPSFDEAGAFVVIVIKNRDWDSPLFKASAGWDKADLNSKIEQALDVAQPGN
ncbi:Uncharacterised protein [Leminorella richardii]|uniref:Uncharacterized protein n=1 Tax=Leminorella richardii TaxID=158841 RepID=A0A2X4UFX4_9GAMM|nr:hypothetical protein [Leminorella richardii]SQI34458.1 Uncharacterised protein [Leminorella richardii]